DVLAARPPDRDVRDDPGARHARARAHLDRDRDGAFLAGGAERGGVPAGAVAGHPGGYRAGAGLGLSSFSGAGTRGRTLPRALRLTSGFRWPRVRGRGEGAGVPCPGWCWWIYLAFPGPGVRGRGGSASSGTYARESPRRPSGRRPCPPPVGKDAFACRFRLTSQTVRAIQGGHRDGEALLAHEVGTGCLLDRRPRAGW